ncbi:hypothetical protein AB1Y20_008208 [Prymnesium parvum]|uniref:KRAB-A domain-containing 2-like n=1 Tax=Prymnesium parvum TaxID=97485 RepID=A0AB34IU36_PRYPA
MNSVYFRAEDMDSVQDQVVGRIERSYWRAEATDEDEADSDALVDDAWADGAGDAPMDDATPQDDEGEGEGEGEDAEEHEEDLLPGSQAGPSSSAASARLADTPGRQLKRKAAAQALDAQAGRMKRAATRRQLGLEGAAQLAIGCIVHLRIEDVDRAKLDNPNATLVVVERTEKDNYRLACKAGVYKELVSRSYLTPVPHATPALLGFEDVLKSWKTMSVVGIRAVAASGSAAGGQGMMHCMCKGECIGGRCSCANAGVKCNSRCHKGSTRCKNHF